MDEGTAQVRKRAPNLYAIIALKLLKGLLLVSLAVVVWYLLQNPHRLFRHHHQ